MFLITKHGEPRSETRNFQYAFGNLHVHSQEVLQNDPAMQSAVSISVSQ